jgi:hypothetical protein
MKKNMSNISADVTSSRRIGSVWLPVIFVALFFVTGIPQLGWAVVAVIGTSHLLALAWWILKGRFWPAGRRMLPFHLSVLAGLIFHIREELTQGFAAAMRQTFHMTAFSDTTYLNVIVFAVPILYILTAIGLWYERPFAEFLSYTLLFGPGFMEWTHYVFPLFQGGAYHYFPGMWTAWVPMIPGLSALAWNIRRIHREESATVPLNRLSPRPLRRAS